MEYYPTLNIDFDSIDWVALANSIGVKLGNTNTPVILDFMDDETRFSLAMEIAKKVMATDKLPKNYITDILDHYMEEGTISSFDKAWIRYHVNKLLEVEG